jgi:hypothetical protein
MVSFALRQLTFMLIAEKEAVQQVMPTSSRPLFVYATTAY